MKFYDTWEGHKILDKKYWPEKLREYLDKEEEFLLGKIKANDVVLDIGCGEGRYIGLLSRKCRAFFGIDSSKTMVAYAKRDFGSNSNITLVNKDIKDTEFPKRSFDCIICMFNTLGNMDRQTQRILLQKSCDFLKNDGIICISVYSGNAKDTQVEFYENIGLKVKGIDKDYIYTDNFVSERFSNGKIEEMLGKAGLRIKRIAQLNEISLMVEAKKNQNEYPRSIPNCVVPAKPFLPSCRFTKSSTLT